MFKIYKPSKTPKKRTYKRNSSKIKINKINTNGRKPKKALT